jgi:hypothetical protein
VRLIAALGVVGIWQTASLLRGSAIVTALLTVGAVALGAWAVCALREG